MHEDMCPCNVSVMRRSRSPRITKDENVHILVVQQIVLRVETKLSSNLQANTTLSVCLESISFHYEPKWTLIIIILFILVSVNLIFLTCEILAFLIARKEKRIHLLLKSEWTMIIITLFILVSVNVIFLTCELLAFFIARKEKRILNVGKHLHKQREREKSMQNSGTFLLF